MEVVKNLFVQLVESPAVEQCRMMDPGVGVYLLLRIILVGPLDGHYHCRLPRLDHLEKHVHLKTVIHLSPFFQLTVFDTSLQELVARESHCEIRDDA
jgi:hypothetical protein